MNVLLIIISLLIYITFGIPGFLYLLFSILTSYIGAKYLEEKKNKGILIFLVTLYTLILLLLRMNTLLPVSIIAPLGISYFTLQIISYLVDVYKRKNPAESNFLIYTLYIVYIPHLFIGPITRYEEIVETLKVKGKITLNNFFHGSLRILWGLFKKLIIAGRLSIIIGTIAASPSTYNGAYALLAMLLYSIELYADFSGGIDIVLGISKIIGFHLKENFNSPYLAETVQDFWRRWHISLSNWLKDYIYIPLGGNKCSAFRKNINVLITFLVSGLWHGINYLLWGFLHGLLVITSSKLKTKNKYLNRTINFLIISLLWSFFIWNNNITSLKMLLSIFTNFNIVELIKNIWNLGLSHIEWIILILATSTLCLFDIRKDKIIEKIKNTTTERKLILALSLSLIILVFGIYGIGFHVTDFIYSKF